MTKLEEIARALNPKLWDQTVNGPFVVYVFPDNDRARTLAMTATEIEDFRKRHQTELLSRARAAVAAMREPNEAMKEAFWNDADRVPETFFPAMIDAILNEKSE